MDGNAQLAREYRTLAEHHEGLAASYRRMAELILQGTGLQPSGMSDVASPDRLPLGVRQREILNLLRAAGPDGMTTGQIAKRIGYQTTNTYNALMAMMRRGIVELVPDAVPQRWRPSSES